MPITTDAAGDVENETDLRTRREAAAYLRRTSETLAYWACRRPGYLPMVRVGGRAMYLKKDLDAFIEANKTCGNDDRETQ